jgi:hypothetical protein
MVRGNEQQSWFVAPHAHNFSCCLTLAVAPDAGPDQSTVEAESLRCRGSSSLRLLVCGSLCSEGTGSLAGKVSRSASSSHSSSS